MKKNKKLIISFSIIGVVLIIAAIIVINLLKDDNKLNILEKQWINNNNKIVYNIGVKNNSNIFGQDGNGVFYDFINDFSNEYNLSINPTTYTDNKSSEGIYFRITSTLDNDKDLVLYKDHYVLVGKKYNSLNNIRDLQNKKIGVLSSQLPVISEYLGKINNVNFTQYEDDEKLLSAFNSNEDINYILVPLNEYLDTILDSNNYINLHISDIPVYYTLYENGGDGTLQSILKKYYNKWISSNFENYYNKESFNFFCEKLNITEEKKDKLFSRTYNYGFVENNPYEAFSNSNFGGIIGVYLEKFKDFSNIDLKFTRFKNRKSLFNAINKKDIDLYTNFYASNTDYNTLKSLLNMNYYIIMPETDYRVINTLKSLSNDEVYVLEDSLLENYLNSLGYLNIKTYKNTSDLKKLTRSNKIVAIDKNNFDYYNKKVIKNYTVRYTDNLYQTYNFNSNASDTFNNLFIEYINYLDPSLITNEGVLSNKVIVRSGTLLGTVATYILYIVFIGIIVGLIVYKSTKKIKIANRIKKEDKMRFIDQLTSLKNRNYLNENIANWNKNTIYPQTTIVIDLNNIQYINDTYGYEEGDKQIKAAANILIKLQLDNSDIMRTDGTEFLVYLVGYSEKQIASYMRKLYKEFKKLPYDYGVVMGYDTITDDIKLLEDAINEATVAMKEKKNEKENEKSQ